MLYLFYSSQTSPQRRNTNKRILIFAIKTIFPLIQKQIYLSTLVLKASPPQDINLKSFIRQRKTYKRPLNLEGNSKAAGITEINLDLSTVTVSEE